MSPRIRKITNTEYIHSSNNACFKRTTFKYYYSNLKVNNFAPPVWNKDIQTLKLFTPVQNEFKYIENEKK